MDRRDRERIAAELGVNGGDVVAELRRELAAAVRDAGELRELLTGALEELAGVRGELAAVRADLANSQAQERAHVETIAALEGKLTWFVGIEDTGKATEELREAQLASAVNGTDAQDDD